MDDGPRREEGHSMRSKTGGRTSRPDINIRATIPRASREGRDAFIAHATARTLEQQKMMGSGMDQQTSQPDMAPGGIVDGLMSRRWPARRIAWASFLCGQGVSYEAIAADPWIQSSAASVRRQLNRLGVRIRDVANGDIRFNASRSALGTFDAAAARRGITHTELIRRTVEILGRDGALLENVLDDQN